MNKSKRKSNVLERPEINTPGGLVLAQLKEKIISELDMDESELVALISAWAFKRNGGAFNTRTSSDKSNAISEFSRSRITVGIFFKFLEVIDAELTEFNLNVKMRDGREVKVDETIVFKEKESFIVEL